MFRNLGPAFRLMLAMTVLTGIVYPLAVTGMARLLFPREASGSLVHVDGRVAGSSLIGQAFVSPRYFHGRPSAAGTGYDPTASGGSNLGPSNPALVHRVEAAVAQFRANNAWPGPVPADAVTASGSGLDPHISPATADAQVARVARARGVPEEHVRRVVVAHLEPRTWGFLGEPRVNVLLLNLDLDRTFGAMKP